MKQFLLIAACILCSQLMYAQGTVSGKVIDASRNTPLIGATIMSGNAATKTNNTGAFTIACNDGARIIVSFIGYETEEYLIKSCDEIVLIPLVASSTTLSNVEITATSNQNKSVLFQPLSITKLGTTEIKRGTGLFMDDVINTNVPGVIMQRRTVSAGQQFNIRGYGNGVRGTNGPQ